MAVTAELKLETTKLLYQQTTICETKITNGSRQTLRDLNPLNDQAAPTILVTNVTTGEVSTHRLDREAEEDPFKVDVQRSADHEYSFSLTQLVALTDPGLFDLQAHYEWQGGQVTSPAVRLKVLPSNPRTTAVETGKGGPAALLHCAWVNNLSGSNDRCELWLSDLMMLGKPRVHHCILLEDLEKPIKPHLAVPPNQDVNVQWVAWIDGKSLRYLLRQEEDVASTASVGLDSEKYRIIPPLLLNLSKSGGLVEGADVMLYQPGEDAANGRFLVKHLSLSKKDEPPPDDKLAVPGSAPQWAETAYLTDQGRHTFFIVSDQNKTVLKLASWSPKAPPTALKDLASYNAKFMTADLWQSGDAVAGAILAQKSEDSYAFYIWSYKPPDAFVQEREVAVSWPHERAGIDRAIARVSTAGDPFALLRSDAKEKKWFFCGSDGSTSVLTGPAEKLHLPADILFRGGDDPVILHTGPDGRGFLFAMPPT